MDPLSITVSVITILSTIDACADFLHDIKRAPKERQKIYDELQGLRSVIEALQRRQEDSQAAGSQELDDLFQRTGELNENSEYSGPKNGKPNGDMALFYQTVAELDGKLGPKEQPKVWERLARKVNHHWDKKDFKRMLEDLERARSRIHMILDGADHRETQSTIRRMEKQQEDQRRLREEAEREAEKTAIQKWLSPFSFSTRQDELCKDRCPTGDWFLKDETFQSWVLGPPRYLLCYGEAGAGKVCTWAQLRRMFAPDKLTL